MLDYDQGPQVADLRSQLRRLIADNVPTDYLGAFTDDPADLEVAQSFCRLLAAEGLLCAAWPDEFGGRDASPWEQTAVREEMWAHHEPRGAQYMGVNWVGPALMRHGTDEQQRLHLPPIAAGEVIWCQGFSEPDAGSDLASLQTAARRDGDGWRISGQKIWTSYATMAQWCFLLARTSRGEKKQQGITVFLVPMDAPGIEVRPIPCMLGPHHLNEVFLDDVWVTEADVLGDVDEGWKVVQEVLAFERVGIARYARVERLLQWAPAALGDAWDAPARRAAQPLVPDAGPRPPGAAARLPGHRHPADRPGAPRRHGRLPHRRHPPRPGERGGAHGHRRRAPARRSRRRAFAGQSRTTTGTRCRPPWRPAASRCNGSCWPEPCWRRREHRPQPRGGRVRRHRPPRARGRGRRRAGPRRRERGRPRGRRRQGARRPRRLGPRPPGQRRGARGRGRPVPQRRLVGRAPPRGRAGGAPARRRRRRPASWWPATVPRAPSRTRSPACRCGGSPSTSAAGAAGPRPSPTRPPSASPA